MKAPTTHRSSIFQILKQHFVGPKKIDLQVSAYGKLPIYKDFLRQGLAGQDAQMFRRWLDRGASKFWAERDGYRESEIPPHAFMVAFPATGHQLLGYLWGSHDHGGLRSFPFVLFVSLPVSKSPAPLSLLHALDQVVEQAQAMRRKLSSMHSLDEYYPFIRTARMQIEMHSEKSLREQLDQREEPTIGDLGDIFYGEDDPADRWPHLIRHVQTMAEGQTPVSSRLPRTEALPAWELNALWCLMLQNARQVSRNPLQLFYSPGDGTQGVTVLHRDLQPEDIFALHPEMPDYDAIQDLRREVPGTQRPGTQRPGTQRPESVMFEAPTSEAESEESPTEHEVAEEVAGEMAESPAATETSDEDTPEDAAEVQGDTADEEATKPEPSETESDDGGEAKDLPINDGSETETEPDDTAEHETPEDETLEDPPDDEALEDPPDDDATTDEPVEQAASDEDESTGDHGQEASESGEDDGEDLTAQDAADSPVESEDLDEDESTDGEPDDPESEDAQAEPGDGEDGVDGDPEPNKALAEEPAADDDPTPPAPQLAVPNLQSALGKAQRAKPPIALLDADFWSE